MKNNIIQNRTFDFALMIIGVCKELRINKEYVLANQLLRSGTSIGANVEEAIGGASRKDFLSKLIIANKEARETKYWLRLISVDHTSSDVINSLSEVNEIINILSRIILSTKSKINK